MVLTTLLGRTRACSPLVRPCSCEYTSNPHKHSPYFPTFPHISDRVSDCEYRWVLPLEQTDLANDVYLQKRLWPDFGGKETVLELKSVTVGGLVYTDLTVA